MTLNHHRVGQGEPLVLIHGVGSRWQVWEPVIEILKDSFDVIAVDLPGFGASAPLAETTVPALADALIEFLNELGLDRPHLGGNSMGGYLALELAARGRARTVTAYSPIAFWDKAGRIWCQQSLGRSVDLAGVMGPVMPTLLRTAAGRTALLYLVFGKPWAISEQVALDTANGAVGAPGFRAALASFTDVRLPEVAPLTDLPVTIAWGNRDILLPYATQSRRAREFLPGARHETLRGSGHTPFFDDPEGCARLLLDQRGQGKTG